MGRMRCPDCGKRVPDEEPICPRCGHAIPLGFAQAENGTDSTLYEIDEWGDDFDDEGLDDSYDDADDIIDDPQLLARAEAHVKGLPLYDLSGMSASQGWTMPDGEITRPEPRPPDRPKPRSPISVGGECPVCGRQAQNGWEVCPWCGAGLP